MTSSTLARLRRLPSCQQLVEHPRRRWRQERLGLVVEQPVGLGDERAGLGLAVTEGELLELGPRLVGLQVGQQVGGCLAFGVVDPWGGEHDPGVVGQQRSLLGVDRDQRDLRLGVLAEGGRVPGRVALVVVPDRLLLDRHGGDVGEPGALVVGALQVGEEGEGGVAVVDDRPLDPLDELAGLGVGQVLLGEVAGELGGGEVGADGGVEAGGGVVGVGLAEPELPPFGVAVAGPAGVVAAQVEQVGPAKLLLGPAEGLGHRPRHGDHQRRGGDLGGAGRDHLGPVGGLGPLLEQSDPAGGRRRPHVWSGSVGRLVPAVG